MRTVLQALALSAFAACLSVDDTHPPGLPPIATAEQAVCAAPDCMWLVLSRIACAARDSGEKAWKR